MRYFANFLRAIMRFLVLWVADGLSLLLTATLLPGLQLAEAPILGTIPTAFAVVFLLSIVNLLIRPLILLLAKPLGFIALFIVGFFVNAITLGVTAWLLPTFEISGILSAIMGGLIFSAVNIIITGLTELDEEGSFYQSLIERQAKRQRFTGDAQGRGLVMLEIDGLSYHHLKKAIAEGRMPTLQRIIEQEGYTLSRVDCGIPSQTSACQAGIMFGDNYDIPAFRWYDKDQQKLIVSGHDAAELNGRYAHGNGLMRGGSSINNMLNGDAEKSLLTMANLLTGSPEEKKRRAEDVYLLLLNPYFLTRTLILFLGEVILELWQGWQQQRQKVWPRLNRTAHFYPFVRAATTVLMRDISINLTILDVIRGAPSIYTTWPGYDEVAHHSGPWSSDAFQALAGYDRAIAHVYRAIQTKAPRPYELIILSDHGQSNGPTFKQRYGLTLKEFIEQHLPGGVSVAQAMGGDTGVTSLAAASGELVNIQQQGVGGAAGRLFAQQGQKLLEQGVKAGEADTGGTARPAQVTAYGSGNLAQVYFDLHPRKIKLGELNQAFPGMVEALLQHEGIGLVCGYEDDGTPVALGKHGRRNLHTGQVVGDDPLKPYAPDSPATFGAPTLETRVWQVRRVMNFPHAGDLMVISTVYPDGTVAALEELIGNHGGLGGEQTDAFIFHPPDLVVSPTIRNAADVFGVLNARRGLPVQAKPLAAPPVGEEWRLANLWAGLKNVKRWGGLTARALVLDRTAYRQIVSDPAMTGPALLLGLGFSALGAAARSTQGQSQNGILAAIIGWLLSVLFVFVAGWMLTHKGHYTRTLRALGFARVGSIFTLLAFIPTVAPLAFLLATLVSFVATWMGAAEAHETWGWRTLLLPFLAIVAQIIVPLVGLLLLGSAAHSIEDALRQLGLI